MTEVTARSPYDYTRQNAVFWNELCGSGLARSIGITDASASSLARFDRAYLDLYPYLLGHVRPEDAEGKRVVEVGLGYGTLGQRFLEAGARYTGVDVAPGPAAMMNHRARLLGRHPCAVRGSALALPEPSDSIDHFVSIGCFHHTGSVEQCIREAYRVLKPRGIAVVMVYNQFSYRRWLQSPLQVSAALTRELMSSPADHRGSERERRRYDADSHGAAAPETVFMSERRVRALFQEYSRVEIHKENCGDLVAGGHLFAARRRLLKVLGPRAGLDLYITAHK